ncbi:hypothetical protein Pla175_17680 [Pirellulimonas nuda]|uniref:Uncharacterized protein n=1 Tax=Pirellulimonas nuda TaxID=2528009 RepID=A0A518DA82_9BACT|nr:hypothetical protein [Pirellulimonas nuda]QDU88392.1 hypothetical protein Pla175_17680 [Pirellulimonas nuda]
MEDVSIQGLESLFRPPSTRHDEFRVAIEALSCVLNGHKCVYIATPVTGGPRFVQWYKRNGIHQERDSKEYSSELREHVIAPNTRDAKVRIEEFRRRSSEAFIDPSEFYVKMWTQSDYRHFWSLVIERFAARAIFLDGWHLSSGCVYEFLVTNLLGIPAKNQSSNDLTIEQGLTLAREGRAEINGIGVDTEFVDVVIRKLAELSETSFIGDGDA